MFSPVIMLLLGGFAIAGALSKHFIAKAAAMTLLSRVRTPRPLVLAVMFIATFASMWISNVAVRARLAFCCALSVRVSQPVARTSTCPRAGASSGILHHPADFEAAASRASPQQGVHAVHFRFEPHAFRCKVG